MALKRQISTNKPTIEGTNFIELYGLSDFSNPENVNKFIKEYFNLDVTIIDNIKYPILAQQAEALRTRIQVCLKTYEDKLHTLTKKFEREIQDIEDNNKSNKKNKQKKQPECTSSLPPDWLCADMCIWIKRAKRELNWEDDIYPSAIYAWYALNEDLQKKPDQIFNGPYMRKKYNISCNPPCFKTYGANDFL